MMKYCKRCGKYFDISETVCQKCGFETTKSDLEIIKMSGTDNICDLKKQIRKLVAKELKTWYFTKIKNGLYGKKVKKDYWLVILKGEVIGVCIKNKTYIESFAIREDFKRKGLGKLLMSTVQSKQLNGYLNLHYKNEAAGKLYLLCNFKNVDTNYIIKKIVGKKMIWKL